jgi:soluble lytic murein transglycosylase-like protein
MKSRKRGKQLRAARQHFRHLRRRGLQSMLLVGATGFFAPHAGHSLPKVRSVTHTHTAARALVPNVEIATEFYLPRAIAYEGLIQEAAKRYAVNADLIRAVIRTESAFDAVAVSTAGALGLMQLMPALAEELGVEDPMDPRENIMAGVRYLSYLLDVHQGNVPLALASYNAGPGAVDLYQGIPPFPETQRYVKTITEQLAEAEANDGND